MFRSLKLEVDPEEMDCAVFGGVPAYEGLFNLCSARFRAIFAGSGPPDGLVALFGIWPMGACILACALGSPMLMPLRWYSSFLNCFQSWADGSPALNHSFTWLSQRPLPSFCFASRLPVLSLRRVPSLLVMDGLYSEMERFLEARDDDGAGLAANKPALSILAGMARLCVSTVVAE